MLLAALLTGGAAAAQAAEVAIGGLAWRQLTDTAGAGLSWDDVRSVCPLDETPCSGSVKGIDFTGWTWASSARVDAMLEAITGLEVPFDGPHVSSVERVYDLFDAVLDQSSVGLSHGLAAPAAAPPAGGTVDAVVIRDAKVSSGGDRIAAQPIATDATEVSGGFFGPQPLGVFLVRDPDLELCANGIDDDGDGAVDVDDDDCQAANAVVNGLEWRQVTDTVDIDFRSVVDICPAGGFPCSGSIGAVDFTGWIWASAPQVVELLFTLTGARLTASPSSIEFFGSDPIPTVFANLSPTQGTPAFGALYGYTYDSSGEDGPAEPYPEEDDISDPATCNNGLDDDGDGKIDSADANCLTTNFFLVSNQAGSRIGTLTGGFSNAFRGYFLYREPQLATPESCDNTLDDDGNGLVDADDPACEVPEPRVGLLVRCLHEPIWVDEGGSITARARAIDRDGNDVVADRVEVYVTDAAAPAASASGATTAQATRVVSGRSVRYGCLAERGSEQVFSGWREVDIGEPEFDAFRTIPVIYNGPFAEKIDIVFLPDLTRHPQGAEDPVFLSDVHQVIDEGLYEIPWFVRNQADFNFWIGRDLATVVGGFLGVCVKSTPAGFRTDYAFADAVGILHDRDCRDNASLRVFTTEFDAERLQVVAHEIGHAAFTLSDEYEGPASLYFTLPDFPNLFPTEGGCRSAAQDRGFDPDECRLLSGASGFNLGGRWIFEPDYSALNPETPDLMQQTGEDPCDGGTGDCAQYRVGPSEIDRMEWKLRKCRAGRC